MARSKHLLTIQISFPYQCIRANLAAADEETVKILVAGAHQAGLNLTSVSPYPALFRRLGLPIYSPTFSVPEVSVG